MSIALTHTYSFVQVCAYATDKMLLSLGNIIRDSGLPMGTFVNNREVYERGIKTWLLSGHFEVLMLEIYNPPNDQLIRRWDFDWSPNGDGELGLWANPEEIRYHLLKSGKIPSQCTYVVKVHTKPNEPHVDGWTKCTLRSTSHLSQHSLGTTIGASSYRSRTAYWN